MQGRGRGIFPKGINALKDDALAGKPDITPFTFHVPDDMLAHIRDRVAAFPWHDMPDDAGWQYGTNMEILKDFCTYWIDGFDWRAQEARINSFANYQTHVDGIDMHFIHEAGSGPNPMPLMIAHGWPGSVAEFHGIIDMLAHPERFGGDIADAFTVIAPSLPGFAFSGPPPRPYGPRRMAGVINALMTQRLGIDRYMAQGGDWGSAIASWLGLDHAANCSAIHINALLMRHAQGPQTADEEAWARAFEEDQIMEAGYRTQMATRPQTLGYAMMDSPVGIAAWMLEKFHAWSDVRNDDIETAHSMDALLTQIMIYITTRSFTTASWIYYGRREEGGRVLSPEGARVEVPTACALFPAEMLRWSPRSYAERIYNIRRWTEMPRGGHFAAMEEPALLVEDIRAFARMLRT
jgi:pimeloyl-ACP methyl ester carboxylesterase